MIHPEFLDDQVKGYSLLLSHEVIPVPYPRISRVYRGLLRCRSYADAHRHLTNAGYTVEDHGKTYIRYAKSYRIDNDRCVVARILVN